MRGAAAPHRRCLPLTGDGAGGDAQGGIECGGDGGLVWRGWGGGCTDRLEGSASGSTEKDTIGR